MDPHHAGAEAGSLHVVVDDGRDVVVGGVRQEVLGALTEDHAQQGGLLPQRVLPVAADVVEQAEKGPDGAALPGGELDELVGPGCQRSERAAVCADGVDPELVVGEGLSVVVGLGEVAPGRPVEVALTFG